MRISKALLNILNILVSLAIALGLVLAGSYSAYALWDNRQVYNAAENVQATLKQLKPVMVEEADEGPGFEELLKINPDVCAWLTMDNTGIDYPVLQGETNLSYISTDVYGDFALAGSIFLDSRCARDFSDGYNLTYGHHMEGHRMFGDLELYKDAAFFAENRSGTLILPDRSCRLEVIACLQVGASEPYVFETQWLRYNVSSLLDYVEANAVRLHADTLAAAKAEADPRILALSTCASEFTDARTIVITLMEPYLQ